jgi:Predicted GTPase
LSCEELRLAVRCIGRLTGTVIHIVVHIQLGRIDVEEILDVLFRDFCIGK